MNKEQADCLKIPVVVGVTGHIDIAEEESWVLRQLEKFWVAVRQIVGEETPIVLLSSIAQGADHYVVKTRPKDVKYCVVLPFAQEDYEHDFVKYAMKPTALEEFRQDLASAFKVIQCAAEVGNYAAASDYVRSRSDILVTLWDGYESLDEETKTPKRGGTYHQIRTAFGMDDILVHHQEKAHLIVNLTVSRKSRKSEHKKNEDCVCSFPDVSASTLNVVKWDEEKGYSTQTLDEWVVQFLKKIEIESQETKG